MSDNNEKTVQKNLNLRESYAEALEEAAKEIYGSSYKQARVVEALLDETHFQPASQRIKDDLRKNGFGIDPIQRQEEEEDEPDASELSVVEQMSQLKKLDVDKGETVAAFVEQAGSERVERSLVVGIIQTEADYSQSMAYNIANDALGHLIPSPFADERLDEWAQETASEMANHASVNIDGFADFAGINELPVEIWYTDEDAAEKDYRQVLARITVSDVSSARKKAAFNQVAEARPLYVSEDFIKKQRKQL